MVLNKKFYFVNLISVLYKFDKGDYEDNDNSGDDDHDCASVT